MNLYIVICAVACAISSASSASMRFRKQVWQEQFPDRFEFPDQPFPVDRDDFNQVIDFPNTFDRPNFNQNGFRPPPNNRPPGNNRPPANNRPPRPTTTTPTTTAAWSSTPRTFHLAPEGCNCLFTPQFNPVCGSDGNTYKNSGLLKCFRRCGINVSQRRMGAC